MALANGIKPLSTGGTHLYLSQLTGQKDTYGLISVDKKGVAPKVQSHIGLWQRETKGSVWPLISWLRGLEFEKRRVGVEMKP